MNLVHVHVDRGISELILTEYSWNVVDCLFIHQGTARENWLFHCPAPTYLVWNSISYNVLVLWDSLPANYSRHKLSPVFKPAPVVSTRACKADIFGLLYLLKFILFHSILLFYSTLFYSILFYSIVLYCTLLYSILFYFPLFYSILLFSILR